MIKLISLLRKNPALSDAEFRAYWQDVHAPLVRSLLPGLRHYVACFPVDGSLKPLDADAIVELGFDDVASMEREMGDPRFNSDFRIASSTRLLDMDLIRNFVVEVEEPGA